GAGGAHALVSRRGRLWGGGGGAGGRGALARPQAPPQAESGDLRRGALRPRDGELARGGACPGGPGLRGVRRQVPWGSARGERPVLDRGGLLPEPGLRAGGGQIPEGG